MADSRLDHERMYRKHVQALEDEHDDHDVAMQQAVGGEFEVIGQLELDLIVANGLPADGFLIDVGCGSGRLTAPLTGYLRGDYLGTDIVPELLEHARSLANRPDWRFELSSDFIIPAADDSADMVCFFSVFTHLLHQESYRYLREAYRVLRPGGKVVFSFLEFAVDSHWNIFEVDVQEHAPEHPLTQSMSRDGISSWAAHLGFEVENIWAGDVPYIPVSKPVILSGNDFRTMGSFGQSAAVLRK